MIYGDETIAKKISPLNYTAVEQSLNLYVYCINDPVRYGDILGCTLDEIKDFFLAVMAELTLANAFLAPVYDTCGAISNFDGPYPVMDIIAGIVAIGAVGYSVYQVATCPKVISLPETKVQSEEKSNPILLNDIVIFRYNGINPGNLTPKAKDVATGLSFSTIPKPGAAMTTIGALNATGIVFAVKDGPTHVSVKPVGATVQEWISTGTQSIWTAAVKSVVVKVGG